MGAVNATSQVATGESGRLLQEVRISKQCS
jgi:hypothetical protein